VLDSAEAWALALHGDPEPAHALLTRARAVAAGIDFYDALFELDWVDAQVHACLGERERARTLLSGLVEWNEQRGRQRYADRYHSDLAELA
jgi:hypothetical protein